ncbi:MAG: PIG-L family deacetylase [Clostridia bacterium]|nr:PIG-L family deacetylase [Clostridia bacterium]
MKILIIAPHPDDEVLGVGGTALKRAQCGDEVTVCVVTRGVEPLFPAEAVEKTRAEAVEAHRLLGIGKTLYLDFPSVMLESVPRYELNAAIARVVAELEPDEVYIPHSGDMQLDHRLVADAAMVALRPKYKHKVARVYAYETVSETGWNTPSVQNAFLPTVYEDISDTLEAKLEAMACYRSQLDDFPGARSLEALRALAVFRGTTVGVAAAEAFALIREIRL